MKKLLAVICILVVIFIGMYIYKTNISRSNISIVEVNKIQEFISKIYLWEEISGEALPKFNNINEAPDLWVWEVVKKNLEQYELTYEEIQEKAIEIFGKEFTKQFPKQGSEYIYYDESTNKYLATGIGLNELEDLFFIKEIKRTKRGYEAEIVEYLEDYSEEIQSSEDDDNININVDINSNTDNQEMEYNIYIRNLKLETIITTKNTESESSKIEKIKENIDKFSTKIVTIVENDRQNVYRKCKMRQLGQVKFVSFLCRKM